MSSRNPAASRLLGFARAWAEQDRIVSAALFALALAPRLYVALAWSKEPVWDGHYYHFGATRIANGLGYSEDVLIDGMLVWKPWCHYPVGYSGFLGFIYKLFGSSIVVAPLANAVVGALTVVLIHRLARHLLGLWRARAAGLLCALHPGLILYTSVVMTESLAASSVALAGWIAFTWRRQTGGVIGSGVALGLAALVRPTALLALPLLYFVFPGDWRRRSFAVGLASIMALATIAPWTLRNCRVMDGCALISTNGGWNLAIGALTETGRFTALSAEDGCRIVTGQVQQDRCWGAVGRQRILQDPWRWLSLVPDKLAHTYNHESFAVGYLAEADPQRWPEARKDAWRSALTIFHHLLMFAATLGTVAWCWPRRAGRSAFARASLVPWAVQTALLGLVLGFTVYGLNEHDYPLYWLIVLAPLVPLLRLPGAPWQGPLGSWLLGLVATTSLTHAIFFGDDRYHITISPMLCILAAAALRRPAREDIVAREAAA